MAENGRAHQTVIKKYANRRLYNTAKSSYVTLDHLAQMVREGQDFVVNDAKTGEDITRGVLAQIIFEEENRGEALLPVQFLRQLIGFYGGQMQGVLPFAQPQVLLGGDSAGGHLALCSAVHAIQQPVADRAQIQALLLFYPCLQPGLVESMDLCTGPGAESKVDPAWRGINIGLVQVEPVQFKPVPAAVGLIASAKGIEQRQVECPGLVEMRHPQMNMINELGRFFGHGRLRD